MSRVVNPNAPGKIRSRQRRTIAELLYRLGRKQQIDEEAKDMAAAIIFALRRIQESVMQTVLAWEKRDYWQKADRFMRDWDWAEKRATELETLLLREDWEQLPLALAQLMPYFVDIETKKMTRDPSHWRGAYRLLRAEHKQRQTAD